MTEYKATIAGYEAKAIPPRSTAWGKTTLMIGPVVLELDRDDIDDLISVLVAARRDMGKTAA